MPPGRETTTSGSRKRDLPSYPTKVGERARRYYFAAVSYFKVRGERARKREFEVDRGYLQEEVWVSCPKVVEVNALSSLEIYREVSVIGMQLAEVLVVHLPGRLSTGQKVVGTCSRCW